MSHPVDIRLITLQEAVGEWSRENFPRNESVDPLLGLGEELGELMHAHLKGRQGIRHTPEEVLAMKKDAVGDIVIYLCDYCAREKIDLEAAVASTWMNIVSKRDWKKNPNSGASH